MYFFKTPQRIDLFSRCVNKADLSMRKSIRLWKLPRESSHPVRSRSVPATLPCKAKRLYLCACNVRKDCTLALSHAVPQQVNAEGLAVVFWRRWLLSRAHTRTRVVPYMFLSGNPFGNFMIVSRPSARKLRDNNRFRATGSPTTHWTYDIVATLNQRTWRWLNAAKTSYSQWEAVDSSAQWTRYIDPMLGHRLWWFSPGHPIFNWYVWLDITLPRKRKRQYIDCLHEFAQWTMVWLK